MTKKWGKIGDPGSAKRKGWMEKLRYKKKLYSAAGIGFDPEVNRKGEKHYGWIHEVTEPIKKGAEEYAALVREMYRTKGVRVVKAGKSYHVQVRWN